MNQVNLVGRMVRDAEDINSTTKGVRFSLAVEDYNPSTKSRETTFINCVAFGDVSDVIKNYAPKGKPVRVTGRLANRKYTPTKGVHAGHEVEQTSIVLSGYDGFELLPGTKTEANDTDEGDEALW